jgi:hypothetical protein
MWSFVRHLEEETTKRKRGVERLHALLSLPSPNRFITAYRDMNSVLNPFDEPRDKVFRLHMKQLRTWYSRFHTLQDVEKREVQEVLLQFTHSACPTRREWVYKVEGDEKNRIFRGKRFPLSDLKKIRFSPHLADTVHGKFLVGKMRYASRYRYQSWSVKYSIAESFSTRSHGHEQAIPCVFYMDVDPKMVVIGNVLSEVLSDYGRVEKEVVIDGGSGFDVSVMTPVYAVRSWATTPSEDQKDIAAQTAALLGEDNAKIILSNPKIRKIFEEPY